MRKMVEAKIKEAQRDVRGLTKVQKDVMRVWSMSISDAVETNKDSQFCQHKNALFSRNSSRD